MEFAKGIPIKEVLGRSSSGVTIFVRYQQHPCLYFHGDSVGCHLKRISVDSTGNRNIGIPLGCNSRFTEGAAKLRLGPGYNLDGRLVTIVDYI